MKIDTICQECGSTFQAERKELNRGNGKFCNLICAGASSNKTRITYNHVCNVCSGNYTSTSKTSTHCSAACKYKAYRDKQNKSTSTIKNFYKSLGHLPCEICGWKETSRDLHHIIPVSKGGINSEQNLISLCPNHHRMVHANLISEEQLLSAVKTRTISSSLEPSKELDA